MPSMPWSDTSTAATCDAVSCSLRAVSLWALAQAAFSAAAIARSAVPRKACNTSESVQNLHTIAMSTFAWHTLDIASSKSLSSSN